MNIVTSAKELGGMLIDSVSLAISSIKSSSHSNKVNNKNEKINLCNNEINNDNVSCNYNNIYDKAIKQIDNNHVNESKDPLVLSSRSGNTYDQLKKSLYNQLGILLNDDSDDYAIIDLRFLLSYLPTFESERKLTNDLYLHGLVLGPGELHGLSIPGYYFISSPYLLPNHINTICNRLKEVIVIYQDVYKIKDAKTFIGDNRVNHNSHINGINKSVDINICLNDNEIHSKKRPRFS
mmetsp:Transcript_6026/g.5385  ORF Transcript_6026/g.5385 Transcript_6026/m.5385 type:complete len:236 (-) Transcript_6026:80-787(-)